MINFTNLGKLVYMCIWIFGRFTMEDRMHTHYMGIYLKICPSIWGCVNSRDRSLEDRLSVVTKCFLAFPSSFWAISTGSIGSTVEAVLVESGDCDDCSIRSTFKGLFCNLQVVCCLMEGWFEYLD